MYSDGGAIMSPLEIVIAAGILYTVADFITGMMYKRCIMPGLKCRECKE